MTTTFIPQRGLPPPSQLMGQPSQYEMDPFRHPMYPGGYPQGQQQPIYLPASIGQPVQVMPGQFQGQNMNSGMFIPPSHNVFHSHAGDLHIPGQYIDLDQASFVAGRHRRRSFSNVLGMNMMGQYPFPQSQMGVQMEYHYPPGMVDSCDFCRANHPQPHPPMLHSMHSMHTMNRRPMGVYDDDAMSGASLRSRGSQFRTSQDGMYDPMDHPLPPQRNPRAVDWHNSDSSRRQRSMSRGRIQEVSDDSDDEIRGRKGPANYAMGRGSRPQSRSGGGRNAMPQSAFA